jgi:hypothetical protein
MLAAQILMLPRCADDFLLFPITIIIINTTTCFEARPIILLVCPRLEHSAGYCARTHYITSTSIQYLGIIILYERNTTSTVYSIKSSEELLCEHQSP